MQSVPSGVNEPQLQVALELGDETRALHLAVLRFHKRVLTPTVPGPDWAQDARDDLNAHLLEGGYVEAERAKIASLVAQVPTEAEPFLAWFESLERSGPGQHDALCPFLAERASLEAMQYFLRQEVAGEAGFEDLVALTQVKMPVQAKLEMARNYWDELGRGHESAMHGPLLARLARALDVDETPIDEIATEPLALGNLMTAFGRNRRYAYQSVGALGVIELTAPARAKHVFTGLKRLGHGDVGHYFALHSTLDIKHARAWNAEILGPLVASDGRLARPIAEGALLRLEHGKRCFERYRATLVAMGEATSADFAARH